MFSRKTIFHVIYKTFLNITNHKTLGTFFFFFFGGGGTFSFLFFQHQMRPGFVFARTLPFYKKCDNINNYIGNKKNYIKEH